MPNVVFIHWLEYNLCTINLLIRRHDEGKEVPESRTILIAGQAAVRALIALTRIIQQVMNRHHLLLENMYPNRADGIILFHTFHPDRSHESRPHLHLVWTLECGSELSLGMSVFLEDLSIGPPDNPHRMFVFYDASEERWLTNHQKIATSPTFFGLQGDCTQDELTREQGLALIERMVDFFAHPQEHASTMAS